MNKISSQDRSALIRLASSLPAGDETRKAILAGLSQTAAAFAIAVEPYQKVEGVPSDRSEKVDFLRVKNEKELRQLSDLLDHLFAKGGKGRSVVPLTPSEYKTLQKWGVHPEKFSEGYGNYTLWVTDATGTEYDVDNDLGIGGN